MIEIGEIPPLFHLITKALDKCTPGDTERAFISVLETCSAVDNEILEMGFIWYDHDGWNLRGWHFK